MAVCSRSNQWSSGCHLPSSSALADVGVKQALCGERAMQAGGVKTNAKLTNGQVVFYKIPAGPTIAVGGWYRGVVRGKHKSARGWYSVELQEGAGRHMLQFLIANRELVWRIDPPAGGGTTSAPRLVPVPIENSPPSTAYYKHIRTHQRWFSLMIFPI